MCVGVGWGAAAWSSPCLFPEPGEGKLIKNDLTTWTVEVQVWRSILLVLIVSELDIRFEKINSILIEYRPYLLGQF